MTLGDLITQLNNEVDAANALEALGDLALFAAVATAGDRYGEAPGTYVANASRRFADRASDDDWLSLMTAMERAPDPGRAALERMLRWSLAQDDAADHPRDDHVCSCGGSGGECHGKP